MEFCSPARLDKKRKNIDLSGGSGGGQPSARAEAKKSPWNIFHGKTKFGKGGHKKTATPKQEKREGGTKG